MKGGQQTLWPAGQGWKVEGGDAFVHFTCRKAEHLAAPSRAGRGGLTVHQGRWAYCDGEVEDREHEWVATGGVPIDRLIDWTKAMDPLRAHTVRTHP